MNAFASIKKAVSSFAIGALIAAGLGLFAVQGASAQLGFTDDAEIPSWATEAIEELMFQGVISGHADGHFGPAEPVNRAQWAKIIVLATGVQCNASPTPTFPDVQPGDWFYDYVQCMADYGWIAGYPDGTFGPAVSINRAEGAKMVVNSFDIDQDLTGAPHFNDVSASDWFYGYVETAYNTGVMQAYSPGVFSPGSLMTRAETARIVYDAQLYIYNDWTPGVSDGGLTIGLSNQTPASSSIPFNATAVPYTTVDFGASADADVEIGRVTFTRLGLGDNDDFDNCWMEFDGFKVGGEKSVTTDDTVELSFNPPIVVPAGQTLTGDLVCSSEWTNTQNGGTSSSSLDDRNIGHQNKFAIIGAEDVLSTAVSVSGNFPVMGQVMTIADYYVSQLEFQPLGSDSTIEVGDEFAEVGKFRMLNDSASNKDIEIRAITFENDCDLDMANSLFNTGLYANGTLISFETIVDGDYVTFRLDDGVTGGYILEDGDAQVFTIRTDVAFAENGDCAQYKLDNYEDVMAIEVGTGFGARVVDTDGNNAEDANATLALYTIDSGDLNVTRDSSNPGNEEYAPGSNEVVVQVVRAVVGQPVEVDGVTFHIVSGSVVSDKDGDSIANEVADFNETFDNFRLYVDDRLIDTQDDIVVRNGGSDGNVADYIIDFSTNFDLAGTSIITLVADVDDQAETGDQIKTEVSAVAGDFDSPEYIASGDSIPTAELLGTATGSFVEVELSQLIITKTDGFSDGTNLVAGEQDVNAMEFTLTNNESGDVNITSIAVGGFGTGSGAICGNYVLALYLEGVEISTKNMNSNCTATFNDISGVIIPSGEEKEFTLVVDTQESSAAANTTATYVVSPLASLAIAKDINPTSGANNNPYAACVFVPTGTTLQLNQTITFDDTNREVRYISGWANITGGAATVGTILTDAYDCSGVTAATGFDLYAIMGESTSYCATVGAGCAGSQSGNTSWNQTHLMTTSTVTIGYTYTAPTAAPYTYTLYVNSAANFAVGQMVSVTNLTSAAGDVCVTGVNTATTPNQITVEDCAGNTVALTGTPATGATVTSVGSGDTIAFGVIAVEADNVENGQEVITYEGGSALTDNTGEVAGNSDENCDNLVVGGASVPNYLCGIDFDLISGGNLSVTTDVTKYDSDILVANETDVAVLDIQFNAAYDDIEVTDIYLENDVYNVASPAGVTTTGYYGDPLFETTGATPTGEQANNSLADYTRAHERFDFMLIGEDGTTLDTAQMQADGSLHFNLGNSTTIEVPKDDSYIATVKVNVRNINEDSQTGQRLRLSLDTDNVNGFGGIEAVTAATGDDIAVPATGWEQSAGVITSQDFVAYRTEMSVYPSQFQAVEIDATAGGINQEIYRFTVSADGDHEVYVNRLSFDISLGGFVSAGGTAPLMTDFVIYEVGSNNSPNTNQVIVDGADMVVYGQGTSTTVANGGTAPTDAAFRVEANFDQNTVILAGTEKTYALFMANIDESPLASTNPTEDDRATVRIAQDAYYVAPMTLSGQQLFNVAGEVNAIVWSDAADPSHGANTADWLNGYEVDVDTNAVTVGQ